MPHVLVMEVNVRNVIQDMYCQHQQHVQHVQQSHNVPHVHKHPMHVRSVILAIIQMEPVAKPVRQSQDVQHVHKQPRHVPSVIPDII